MPGRGREQDGEREAARPPRVTDVARLAGVSPTTVSFVLNENSGQSISDATRRRVLDAVAELGYRPNRTARGLRTQRTGTIGFVTDEIAADPFAGATILGAHEVAWAHGSLLVIVNTTRDRRVLRAAVEDLLERRVDAVVFAVVGTRRLSPPEQLKGVPAVLVNGYAAGGLLPAVLPDDVTGGRAAAALLLEAGHRRVAYLTGPRASLATRARIRGFREAVAGAGADPADQLLLEGNDHAESGYQLTRDLIARGEPVTAIMCGNDRMAVGAYLALYEAGLRIPEDVSVVGYDDQTDLAADVRPALTTIRMPYYQMGRWAVQQIAAGAVATLPPRTLLPCPVVRRSSVGPPARERTHA